MALRSKIAALPESVRDDLNRRLADGLPGGPILDWLNQLPEVRSVLALRFHAQPVSHANLTQWRQTGFKHWVELRESLKVIADFARESSKLAQASQTSIAQGGLVLASLKLMKLLRARRSQDLTELERLARALATVRTAELGEGRLQADLKKLQLSNRKTDLIERKVKALESKALADPAECSAPNSAKGLSPETLEKIRREAKLF